MAEQIRLKVLLRGEIADIRVLLQHPMENGLRKDERGEPVPAHFIQAFSITLNGKPLIEGQLNTAVSKNPLFTFKARGVKAGDKLAVSWADNRGGRRADEFTVGWP